MRHLSLLHRVTAVLSSVLLLQLLLAASGTLCRLHGNHAATDTTMSHSAMGNAVHSGEGMPVSTAMFTVAAADDASLNTTGHCDMTGMTKSCGSPWAPTGCTSMGACVSAVTAIASLAGSSALAAAVPVQIVASANMPLGPTFAPELPPPRA